MSDTLRFLILSEDSGAHATEVVWKLLLNLLRQVRRDFREDRLLHVPLVADASRLVYANLWKSDRANHNQLVALTRELATILVDEKGWVVWHIDGDCTWSEHTSNDPLKLTLQKFDHVIKERVRNQLRRQKPDMAEDAIDVCLNKLILLRPHYSIEAWLYQAIDPLLKLYVTNGQSSHPDTIQLREVYQHDPSSLEEVPKIKDKFWVRSAFNLELASHVKGQVLQNAQKSLAQAVQDLKQAPGLLAAL